MLRAENGILSMRTMPERKVMTGVALVGVIEPLSGCNYAQLRDGCVEDEQDDPAPEQPECHARCRRENVASIIVSTNTSVNGLANRTPPLTTARGARNRAR